MFVCKFVVQSRIRSGLIWMTFGMDTYRQFVTWISYKLQLYVVGMFFRLLYSTVYNKMVPTVHTYLFEFTMPTLSFSILFYFQCRQSIFCNDSQQYCIITSDLIKRKILSPFIFPYNNFDQLQNHRLQLYHYVNYAEK